MAHLEEDRGKPTAAAVSARAGLGTRLSVTHGRDDPRGRITFRDTLFTVPRRARDPLRVRLRLAGRRRMGRTDECPAARRRAAIRAVSEAAAPSRPDSSFGVRPPGAGGWVVAVARRGT